MKIGVSFSPDLLRGMPILPGEQTLLQSFGTPENLLQELRERGVNNIEFRCLDEAQDPEQMRLVCDMLWKFGFTLTIHGRIEEHHEEGSCLAEVFPPMKYVLENFTAYQERLVINLHAFSSKNDSQDNVEQLAEHTISKLKYWCNMSENEEKNVYFALELNRKKQELDPGNSIQGVLGMIDKIDHPKVGIGWDMGHFYSNFLNGLDPSADSLPPQHFLKQTIHTHIHGLSENGKTHFPLLTDEHLPLKKYVQALQNIEYKGVYHLELDYNRYKDDPELVVKSLRTIDWLKSCLG